MSTPALSLTGSRSGSVALVAVLLEKHRADGRRAAVEHVAQQSPPGQLHDAAPDQRVGRRGVARQLGTVDGDDVVAGSGQEHRGRCPGGPGPDDDHVVVARDGVGAEVVKNMH